MNEKPLFRIRLPFWPVKFVFGEKNLQDLERRADLTGKASIHKGSKNSGIEFVASVEKKRSL